MMCLLHLDLSNYVFHIPRQNCHRLILPSNYSVILAVKVGYDIGQFFKPAFPDLACHLWGFHFGKMIGFGIFWE